MVHEATIELPARARDGSLRHEVPPFRLVLNVLLVGLVCKVSIEIGFAHRLPPHNISVLWPMSAILFSVLVATPTRHWWAYTLAAYFSSVVNDVRAGLPAWAVFYIVAGILEIWIAAIAVRRYADGLRAFSSLRSLVVYMSAVIAAPFAAAFVAAAASATQDYWFSWRVWFLSEAVAYFMLAPAFLTWIAGARAALKGASLARYVEACLIGCGLLAISV